MFMSLLIYFSVTEYHSNFVGLKRFCFV